MDFAKFILRLLLILIIPITIAAVTYVFLSKAFFRPLDASNTNKVIVEIVPGKTFMDICKTLADKGILRYPWSLIALARLKKVDTKINAGEYELSPSMTPQQVLAKLMSGEVLKRRVTFKEGQTIWELGKLLEAAGVTTATSFNPALTDPELLSRAGLNTPSFEGYLYPETYFFSRPIDSAHIIWRMIEEGEKHWSPEFSKRAEELRMSRHEIVTLASIIEKESGILEEQPRISSVFHNRLKQGMKLQADPTVIYGISDFNGNLTKEDLQNQQNPYNTYVHFGLPPGPICNPQESAIKAALYPEDTSFLFFVADGTGGHSFSTTLQEHNEKVDKFQRDKSQTTAAAAATPASQP